MVPRSRLNEALQKASLAEKHAALLEAVESDPAIARRLLIERTYPERTPDQRPVEQRPAPETTLTPEQMAKVREHWEGKYQQDPVGTIWELNQIAQKQGERQAMARTNRLVVSNYKASRASDPLFSKYAATFDKILAATDPAVLDQYPEATMERAENMAFGEWARGQRQRITAAGGTSTLPRETPPKTGPSTASGQAPPQPAKGPRRQPTNEELTAAQIYRVPVESIMEDAEDSAPVFGRR
jgi:hypothetical protein